MSACIRDANMNRQPPVVPLIVLVCGIVDVGPLHE